MTILARSKKYKNYEFSKDTSKGQVTIPKKIRDQLGLQTGDVLSFDIESGIKITIRPVKGNSDPGYGILHRENQEALTTNEVESGVAEYFKKKYKAH